MRSNEKTHHKLPILDNNQTKLDQVKYRVIRMIQHPESRHEPLNITFPNKNMPGKICLSPYVSVHIDIHGEVTLCGCAGWMMVTVGNLYINTMQEILSSPEAQAVRASIADGSYIYCNEKKCGVINNNELNDRDNVPLRVQECVNDPTRFYMPNEIILAGDFTCNLSCPSCRTGIMKVDDNSINLYKDLGDRIRKNLFSKPTTDPMRLMLSTSGEVFASPMLLEMINTIPVNDYPNLSLILQTNGLLAPDRWHRLGDMRDRIDSVIVTVDAARADTYERLRRGGKWNELLKSLSWLSDKKKHNGMKFVIRMIVQQDNYQEMEEFWHMGQQFDVDHVEYGRILNWGTFDEGGSDYYFRMHDVFNPTHPDHDAAQSILTNVKKLPRCKFWGGL